MNQGSILVGLTGAALLATSALTFVPAPSAKPEAVSAAARAKPHALLPRLCGSGHFTDREVDAIELFVQAERQRLGRRLGDPQAQFIGTIPVAFHVIYTVDFFGNSIGLLTEAEVEAQIAVLNTAFPNLDFDLVRDVNGNPTSITYTNNSNWFYGMAPGSAAEAQAKTALRWDPTKYLNVYTCQGGGLLGWATFPWELRSNPTNDGVVIAFDTIPGGTPPYDEGDTLVHEVGHWCGLYHTFQGGCSRVNDRVADTPAEASPNYGCPSFRDTCPAAGADPIDNYMDYSDDVCLIRFSAGQETRMNNMINIFRQSALIAP
jgi:hypothetical protein